MSVRWPLFVIAGIGALGASIFIVVLLRHWAQCKQLGLITPQMSEAWHSKMRQSVGLFFILTCFSLSALAPPESGIARLLIVIGALIGDWKVYRLFSDTRRADVQVAEQERRP